MKIIESLEAIRSDRPTAVTLGKFDGLHRAHQILIGNVVRIGNKKGFCPVSVSFDLSPVRILTKKEKEQRLEEAGIGMMIRLPFTAEIMTMEADYFIEEILRGKLHASYVCVGDDFRFGHNRAGDAAMLQKYGLRCGFSTEIIPAVYEGEREISSTWIREALAEGDVETAAKLLGYHYFLTGTVVHGRALGRTIGVPTTNIIPDQEKLLPKFGVYVSRSRIGGKTYGGITNIGSKPTVGGQFVGAETYLFDCDGDLYGTEQKTELLHFLRPEIHFPSVGELKLQLERDRKEGYSLYKSYT
ncbi:MAG: riboflavin biosynthesis protein RibF [Lachnospiraceae bacterium]|nr:riboflavin biosynthesis protein RibF [Lachnospiraceae bacterium]